MFEIAIKADFAAAHRLHGYEGNCKDLHGHTWKVEVALISDRLDPIGMVMDFKILKMRLKEFLKGIDHVYLNDLLPFQKNNPTTEHLAKYIFDEFAKVCLPLRIKKVRVWESETSDVTYYK